MDIFQEKSPLMDMNSDIDFTKENFQLLLAMVMEQQEAIAGLNSKIKKLEGQQGVG